MSRRRRTYRTDVYLYRRKEEKPDRVREIESLRGKVIGGKVVSKREVNQLIGRQHLLDLRARARTWVDEELELCVAQFKGSRPNHGFVERTIIAWVDCLLAVYGPDHALTEAIYNEVQERLQKGTLVPEHVDTCRVSEFLKTVKHYHVVSGELDDEFWRGA